MLGRAKHTDAGALADNACFVTCAAVQVACGSWHTLVRAGDGQVYAWGWNAYGQCCTAPAAAGPTGNAASSGSEHQQQAAVDGEGSRRLQHPQQEGDQGIEGAPHGASARVRQHGPHQSTEATAVLQSIWGAAAAPDKEACVWQPAAVDLSHAAAAVVKASDKEQRAAGAAASGCTTTGIAAGGWHSFVWLQPR